MQNSVVHQEKEKSATLVQGGLEIIIKMKASWKSQEKLTILSAKVAEIAYPVDADYKDYSTEILKVLQDDKMTMTRKRQKKILMMMVMT